MQVNSSYYQFLLLEFYLCTEVYCNVHDVYNYRVRLLVYCLPRHNDYVIFTIYIHKKVCRRISLRNLMPLKSRAQQKQSAVIHIESD